MQTMAIWSAAAYRFVQAMEQVQRGIKLAEQQSAAKTVVSAFAQCFHALLWPGVHCLQQECPFTWSS